MTLSLAFDSAFETRGNQHNCERRLASLRTRIGGGVLGQQQQQQIEARTHSYALDVPITQDEVDRWETCLGQSAPPPAAPNAAFVGGGFVDAAAVLAMGSEAEQQQAVHKLSPMKLFNPNCVVRPPMTKILMHRRKWLPYRQRLPVYQCRTHILDALLNNPVVALVAPSGSGCTLQLPQIISETEVFKTKRLIVVCSTVLAVQRTVERLREERGEETASTTVGECSPLCYGVVEGTHIAVTTSEMLVRQLLCDPLLLNVGCVIFNDFHIRSPTTELCVSLLRSSLGAREEHKTSEHGWAPRVVVCCSEEPVANTVTEFFGADRVTNLSIQQLLDRDIKVGAVGTGQGSSLLVTPSVLYLEETMQWLTRCEEEGSFICRDPLEELRNYVENIGVVAKVMAIEDADFTSDDELRQHWCPLIFSAINQYNLAELKEREALSHGGEPRKQEKTSGKAPAVVVVTPNPHAAEVIAHALERAKVQFEEGKGATSAMEIDLLREGVTPEKLRSVLREGESATEFNGRLVLVTTPMMAQTAFPPTFQVGLVVDCARRSYVTYDPVTDSDVSTTSYSYVQELRQRRAIARIELGSSSDKVKENVSHAAPACMVLQLIPKSVLHSAQHRRVSTDPAHHSLFQLPWAGYVQLYHLLQAREEGMYCRGTSSASSAAGAKAVSLLNNLPRLISSSFIGVSTLSSSRYEQLRRIFAAVEHHMIRLGHLQRPVEEGAGPRLLPLGAAATCIALPLQVLRLLVLSRLYDCVIPASVIAAIWMVGDIFCDTDFDADAMELVQEARVFFSRNSASDVVSAFYAYCMWSSLRETAEEGCGGAVESEMFVSHEALLMVEAVQVKLIRVLEVLGLIDTVSERGPSADTETNSGVSKAIAATIRAIPETALLGGYSLLQCVTISMYPCCAVLRGDGSLLSFGFTEGAKKSSTSGEVDNGREGAQRIVPQLAYFSDQSVVSAEDARKNNVGKPFLYLHRYRDPVSGVAVLDVATPLCFDAAIVACGQLEDQPKQRPTRCRGWTSVMTTAWRQTKCARRLPPAAQLPPINIPLKLYDTIQAPYVVVEVDGLFSFSMRSTTAKWLRLFREQVTCRLRALITDKSWTLTPREATGLREAWDWWLKRMDNAHTWLREERTSYMPCKISPNGDTTESNKMRDLLCPYYQYSSNSGRPPMIVPPRQQQQGLSATSIAAAMTATAPVARQPTAYMGKMPDPVMDNNIKHSARSIAKARSREQETTFLKMYPDLFAFLDPEHEFHPYYLHVLRREAPDLEVLGDNLEELEKFLQEMEEEVRNEVGAQTDNRAQAGQVGDESIFADGGTTGVSAADASYQFQEVNADEYMASYGMQLERSAEHTVRPPTLFKTQNAHPAVSSTFDKGGDMPPATTFFSQSTKADDPSGGILDDAPVNSTSLDTPHSVNQGASSDNVMLGASQSAPPPSDAAGVTSSNRAAAGTLGDTSSGRAPTLMEQLLAMKAGDTTQVATPQEAPSQMPNQTVPTLNVGAWAGGTAAPVTPVMGSGFGLPAVAGGPTVPPSSAATSSLTRDLLEVMGVIPASPAVDPLTIPPPPLPAEAFTNQPPSVLVYPLPSRDFGNIPLILAKALGETMGVKVGPTRIVGNIGRVDVPNHKVEARALALKSFICVGKKVHIFKNDRIVDPARPVDNTFALLSNPKAPGLHLQGMIGDGRNCYPFDERIERTEFEGPFKKFRSDGGKSSFKAQNIDRSFPVHDRTALKKSINPLQIGVLTDSEEDDDDDSSKRSISV